MHALQDLGERLVTLPPEKIERLALPEALHDAVIEAAGITAREARRRHMQYIGKLMRAADPEPIREAIAVMEGKSRQLAARLHRLERWREQLLADEAVLGEIATACPGADLQHLRSLRRAALKEREAGQPPRKFREIFRVLRDLDSLQSEDSADDGE